MAVDLTISSGAVSFTPTVDELHRLSTDQSVTSWSLSGLSDGTGWVMMVTRNSGHDIVWTGLVDQWTGVDDPVLLEGQTVVFTMLYSGGVKYGFSLGDNHVTTPKPLVWNDQSGSVPSDNQAKIMDKLRKGGPMGAHIPVPPRDDWLDGGAADQPSIHELLRIDSPIELVSGNHLSAASAMFRIAPTDGANLPAVIATKNFIDNTGAPSSVAREIVLERIGVHGAYRNRTNGTVLQTSGHGHGFAIAGYRPKFLGCIAGETRGNAFHVDTSSDDGTALGEALEPTLIDCLAIRAGLSSYRMDDTAGIDGGTTDGFLDNCIAAHGNIRADVDNADGRGTDGAAIYIKTAGGWHIKAPHVYSQQSSAGQWAGYGDPQLTHGLVCLAASGTRITNPQIADFGYHKYQDTYYGIWLRLFVDRGATIIGGNAWNRMFNVTTSDLYMMRINTDGSADGDIQVLGFQGKTKAPGSALVNGLKLDASGSGNGLRGIIHGVTFPEMPIAQQLTTTGNATDYLGLSDGLTISGCSWQNEEARYQQTVSSASGVTLDARRGHRHEITLDANATSVTVTNLADGDELVAMVEASGDARNFNLSAFNVADGLTAPGNVAIADGDAYMCKFRAAFGTVFLVESLSLGT